MKLNIKLLAAALAIAGSAAYLVAQDGPGPRQRPQGPGGPGGPGGRMPVPPLMAALDANHDGVIDATEIDHAPAALRKLDKNDDGKLTAEELRPPRREGQRGPNDQGRPGGGPNRGRPPGGPGGPGGQGGPDFPPPPPPHN